MWVVTGDGDALSIGGNHLIHALRRNVNLKILLFNNRIYGLTKGQYSPTSEVGKVTKSTPVGSVDTPFNPVSLALGAEATFVARTMDSDRKHLTETLRAAAEHRGTALVEIYQNCPIFNDGAFDVLKDRDEAQARLVHLTDGEPVRVGTDQVVVRTDAGSSRWSPPTAPTRPAWSPTDVAADDPSTAFALSRLDDPSMAHVPMGIFRSVQRPTYDDLVRAQVDGAVAGAGASRRRRRRPGPAAARQGHLDRGGVSELSPASAGRTPRHHLRRGGVRPVGAVPPVLPPAGALGRVGDPDPPDPVDAAAVRRSSWSCAATWAGCGRCSSRRGCSGRSPSPAC